LHHQKHRSRTGEQTIYSRKRRSNMHNTQNGLARPLRERSGLVALQSAVASHGQQGGFCILIG
jgi:hypothetical protein